VRVSACACASVPPPERLFLRERERENDRTCDTRMASGHCPRQKSPTALIEMHGRWVAS